MKGDSAVSGTVTFEQSTASGEVTVKGDLKGLDPSSSRGFHIQYDNVIFTPWHYY